MHVHGLLLAALHAFSLVVKLTDATRTGLMTPFKFPDGGRPESRLVIARKVKTAPYLEAGWIFGILAIDRVKIAARIRIYGWKAESPYPVRYRFPL